MADPSLERQVFPPGYIGDALFEAGKLPGEIGNLWGKASSTLAAAKDKVMMPMNSFANRLLPQPPQQAQNFQPPAPQMPPQMPPGQPVPPQSHLMPVGSVQMPQGPGMAPPPPGMPQGPMQQPQSVVWGGRGMQSNLMPVNQQMPMGPQAMPPQPVNNIFAQRMARY